MSSGVNLLGDQYPDSDEESMTKTIDSELESAFGRLAQLLKGAAPMSDSRSGGAYPLKRIHLEGLDDESIDESVSDSPRPQSNRESSRTAGSSSHREQTGANSNGRPQSAAARSTPTRVSPTPSAKSEVRQTPTVHTRKLKEEEWSGVVSRLTQPRSTSKLERLRERLLEEEVREVKKAPELCPKSREMAARIAPFMERLDAVKSAAEEKKKRLKEQFDEQERKAMQPQKATTPPNALSTSSDSRKGFDHRLEMFSKWKEVRESKLQQIKQREIEGELKECSFRPKISEHSKKLIEHRYNGARIDQRASMYDEIREKRMQQLVKNVEEERYAVRSPQINPRSRKLATQSSAHDRLYQYAMDLQRKREERQLQLFDEYYGGKSLFQPHLLQTDGAGTVTAVDEESGIVYEFVPVDLDASLQEQRELEESGAAPDEQGDFPPQPEQDEAVEDPDLKDESAAADCTSPPDPIIDNGTLDENLPGAGNDVVPQDATETESQDETVDQDLTVETNAPVPPPEAPEFQSPSAE